MEVLSLGNDELEFFWCWIWGITDDGLFAFFFLARTIFAACRFSALFGFLLGFRQTGSAAGNQNSLFTFIFFSVSPVFFFFLHIPLLYCSLLIDLGFFFPFLIDEGIYFFSLSCSVMDWGFGYFSGIGAGGTGWMDGSPEFGFDIGMDTNRFLQQLS